MRFVPRAILSAALLSCVFFSGDTLLAPQATASFIAPKISISKSYSGAASWYGGRFHGRKTANGERYNMNALTAAHKSLKFGTQVRVTNRHNGRSVVVRINDRGPYAGGRIIDLSRAAAEAIGMIGSGVAPVSLEVMS